MSNIKSHSASSSSIKSSAFLLLFTLCLTFSALAINGNLNIRYRGNRNSSTRSGSIDSTVAEPFYPVEMDEGELIAILQSEENAIAGRFVIAVLNQNDDIFKQIPYKNIFFHPPTQ